MKTYFYFLFFLSLSLAAQNKDAQKRLYYNPMEGDPAYAMGKYEVRIQVYEEAFDTLVTKQNMVNFAKKNHFLDHSQAESKVAIFSLLSYLLY